MIRSHFADMYSVKIGRISCPCLFIMMKIYPIKSPFEWILNLVVNINIKAGLDPK